MSNYKFETLQLHVGQEQADPATDSRAVPIYQTTSYVFRNSQHAADRFGLADAGNIYGRLTNSTQDVFEKRIAALEGGVAALATASGAAAITYTIEALAQAGDHIVAQKTIYGGSYNLLEHTLTQFGVTTTFVDAHDLEEVENAIQPNTKAVYLETLGNPNSDIPDIDAIAAIAHKHGLPLVIDNTFGTPYLIRPIEHGGQKEYTLADGHKFVSAVFGLSGSGKSTLTHAKHGGKYPSIKVLHDDAFIINSDTCASIALEPTYFDKTADYPVDSPDNKYLLTAQNCSATLDEDGKVVLVTEDIRNGNGRAIKSKLWSPNRVDKIESPVNAIFWIMKDPTIPPIVKLKGASLASVMGATLATKRSSAERLKEGVDPNALVVEPYANPFRTYPLVNDYEKFKKLVAEKNVACYIINTGDFMGKKVQKEDTLGILESVVEGRAEFKPWGPFSDIEIMEWDGFVPDLTDKGYVAQMQARMQDRLNYVEGLKDAEGGFNALPDDAADAIRKVVEQANSL